MIIKMSEMESNTVACIKELTHKGGMRRRLCNIGFSCGSAVKYLGRAPLGDPMAFYVKGSIIALRKCDADKINVETEI